ncbi:MAG: type I glutamate--ammonia ligase [Pseudomonadota bacterium]
MATSLPAAIDKLIKAHNIVYVSLIFTDLRGRLQQLQQHISTITADTLAEGFYIDGSSLPGWKAINESDMLLRPDLNKMVVDPFAAQATLKVFCDVHDPVTNAPYARDPRSIAKAAQDYLTRTKIADTAYFGPEAEFFLFDDVKYNVGMHDVSFSVNGDESPANTGKTLTQGNLAHRPRVKGGYFPDAPLDQAVDIRAEMVTILAGLGVAVEKHHHEVAPCQHELGIRYSTLVDCADNMQLYKHVVKNVARAYGKTATFMPKPIFGDNGSGMHVHQSLWHKDKPLFAGKEYAGLSQTCLYYIGGIIKHAKALNAITNPTTNSYKRLVPGYEAPVLLAYSSRNRSASCRIPHATSSSARRVEVRFPDPLANPYLAFSALLMAGLDGIRNKIDPGEAIDKNLYDLPDRELRRIPTVCGSLRDALSALRRDHAFLLEGDVFSKDFIDSYIAIRMEEVMAYETMPHPIEYEMYYAD